MQKPDDQVSEHEDPIQKFAKTLLVTILYDFV